MEHQAPELRIADVPATHRFEAHLGDRLAGYVHYRTEPGRIVFTHTEVMPEFEGKGIGGRLANAALDEARARGLTVVPKCPFIAGYIRRHPEYAALVSG